ncbi:MAG: hypothetical protein CSA65_01960 [Proteobacteria bacterium]|nr:MAG: hypothetical protein CSA65_01960 [Pseudomonadota bacterium]
MRKLALLTSLALIGISCHDSYSLPEVKGPPLKVPAGGAGQAKEGPLEVVFVSPKGRAPSRHAQITVTFNKPVVPLARVEERAEKAPISLDPPVPGKQRWLSSRTLAFTPDKPLQGSSTYQVKVAAGLEAVDGSKLAADKSWRFETVRLKVTRHYLPNNARRWGSPRQQLKLYFNQAVPPRRAQSLLQFVAKPSKGGQIVTIGALARRGSWSGYKGSRDPRVINISPAKPLPLDSRITLVLRKGLVGGQGPLPMERGYRVSFRTYGPFKVTGISCETNCDPGSSVRLLFSTPSPSKIARAAIRVNGRALNPGRSRYPSTRFYLDWCYKPRKRFTVTVAGSLKDRFGQPLVGQRRFTFTTGDYEPYARLPIGAGVLEAKGPKRLPLLFRNATEATLYSKRITPAELSALLADTKHDANEPFYSKLAGVKARQLAVGGRPNKRVVERADLGRLVGKGGRGLLALELQSKLRGRRKTNGKTHDSKAIDRAIVRVTDLGVTAKYSPFGSLVWVTSLATGKPVAGAKVSIWQPGDKGPRWSGKTDKGGLAVGPGANELSKPKEARSYLFVVEKGQDLSYTRSTTQSGIRAWDFGLDETWDDGKSGVLGMIFSERGIYRPGESVHIKGIMRRSGRGGLTLPRGQVSLVISDARGEKLATHQVELSRFGTFHLEQKLPAGAALGRYSVTAKLGKASSYGSFRVEEYRPAEFAVRVKTDKRHYVRGDVMRYDLGGKYLFGAPMRATKYRTHINWRQTSWSPPRHAGYIFHNEISWWGSYVSTRGHLATGRGKLDRNGSAQGQKTLKPAKMNAPHSYGVEATVTDISRQSISNRTTVLLHPGEFYIGAKPKATFISAGHQVEAQIVAVDPKGKRVSGQAIKGTLYRRTWHSVRKKGLRGSSYFVSRPKETAVGSCDLQSAAKPIACKVTAPKAGYYVLRLQARDPRGNPLMSSFGVYVTGPDYVPWRRSTEPRVELIKDRKRYKVGQVARLMIKAPFTNAYGLLTVERNGIYLRKTLRIQKTATWVNVPITKELVPNAFVSVMLVRGRLPPPRGSKKRGVNETDPGKPMFKVGYLKLPISQQDRRLHVKVAPKKKTYRPGEEVVVDLQTTDHRGKAASAELTVFVADEGVLSLVGYKTPTPMSLFYAQRGLSVRTADNRIVLLSRKLFGEKGKKPGGGGGADRGAAAAGQPRSQFVSTPYYNPQVITDASGKAQVRFKLPDNLTTFRVMAVAVSEDHRFGSGKCQLTVNKPLLLLPTLPRLVRVGDTFEAGVVVHNRGGKQGAVTISAKVQGLELEGAASQQLTIPDGGGAEARFTFSAKKPGKAVFTFSASLGDYKDGLKLTRPIKLPLVTETVATFGATESKEAEAFVPSGDIRSDVGGLEVSLSSSALVGLRPGFEYLIAYPHECTEQTTSRLVPLALFKELTTAYGLKKPAEVDALVRKLIARMQRMQRWNGGFGYWASSSWAHPWLSAYATWGLHKAKSSGYAVSSRVMKRAHRFLKAQLKRRVSKEAERAAYDRSVKAFIAYVLVQLGEKPHAELNELYAKRADLPIFARALLVSAMSRAGSDAQATKTVLREVLNAVHQTGKTAKVEENLGGLYAPVFHSSNRSTAMVLEALLTINPQHPLVDKLVAYLVGQRKNGRWRNTQETVYALVGLHRYYKAREQAAPDFEAKVVLDKSKLVDTRFTGRTLKVERTTLPMSKLVDDGGSKGILGFIKEGTGRLHYTATLRYARAKLPTTGWDEGFFVTRTYEVVDQDASSFSKLRGKMPAGGKQGRPQVGVKAGAMVRVKLRIVVPQQMHYVVVDDPLPAGLEALNFNLMTASRSSYRYTSRRYSSRDGRRSWWYTPFYHRETRDDRVQLFADSLAPGVYTYVYLARATTVGRFVAPPTHVEQMYEPEVFGRTGAQTFNVRKP